MALRRAFSRRLFSASPQPLIPRRIFQSSAPPVALPLGPARIRLDGLAPPRRVEEGAGMTVEEARKVLRAAQMELARERLREVRESVVSRAEFVRMCCEAVGGEPSVGRGIAHALDEVGAVVVLGDVVLLRPDLVAKAIGSVIPSLSTRFNNNNKKHIREELREMELKKAEIDSKAEAQVRRELWCGLGFMTLQTAGFMRLTFWELSWDVMEPVCFFATSLYFIAGYAFFLRTSRDPSFEGFFDSRFAAKQRRLMRARNFDATKFQELKRAFSSSSCSPACGDCPKRSTLLGVGH